MSDSLRRIQKKTEEFKTYVKFAQNFCQELLFNEQQLENSIKCLAAAHIPFHSSQNQPPGFSISASKKLYSRIACYTQKALDESKRKYEYLTTQLNRLRNLRETLIKTLSNGVKIIQAAQTHEEAIRFEEQCVFKNLQFLRQELNKLSRAKSTSKINKLKGRIQKQEKKHVHLIEELRSKTKQIEKDKMQLVKDIWKKFDESECVVRMNEGEMDNSISVVSRNSHFAMSQIGDSEKQNIRSSLGSEKRRTPQLIQYASKEISSNLISEQSKRSSCNFQEDSSQRFSFNSSAEKLCRVYENMEREKQQKQGLNRSDFLLAAGKCLLNMVANQVQSEEVEQQKRGVKREKTQVYEVRLANKRAHSLEPTTNFIEQKLRKSDSLSNI